MNSRSAGMSKIRPSIVKLVMKYGYDYDTVGNLINRYGVEHTILMLIEAKGSYEKLGKIKPKIK
jgi:hypothetical protein